MISDVRPRVSGRRVPPSAASAAADEMAEMTRAAWRGRSEGERGYPAPRYPRHAAVVLFQHPASVLSPKLTD